MAATVIEHCADAGELFLGQIALALGPRIEFDPACRIGSIVSELCILGPSHKRRDHHQHVVRLLRNVRKIGMRPHHLPARYNIEG
jgi:hypothetical protein